MDGCMYIWLYNCVYVYMYVCKYVCWMDGYMSKHMDLSRYECM